MHQYRKFKFRLSHIMNENVSILEPLILFSYSLKYLNVDDVISMQNARQAVCH